MQLYEQYHECSELKVFIADIPWILATDYSIIQVKCDIPDDDCSCRDMPTYDIQSKPRLNSIGLAFADNDDINNDNDNDNSNDNNNSNDSNSINNTNDNSNSSAAASLIKTSETRIEGLVRPVRLLTLWISEGWTQA